MDSLAPLVAEDRSTPPSFTLVEILVVVGIISTMSLAAYFAIGRLQVTADTQTSVDKVLAAIQSQRMAAMLGAGVGDKKATAQGLYFEEGSSRYVAFSCASEEPCAYNPSATQQNTEYFMEASMLFSAVTFPNNQILFAPYSGDVLAYIEGQNRVVIQNLTGEATQTIEVSSVGTPTLLP